MSHFLGFFPNASFPLLSSFDLRMREALYTAFGEDAISQINNGLESVVEGGVWFGWVKNPSFPHRNPIDLRRDGDVLFLGTARIDNREEIRLQVEGAEVSHFSDTELIVRAYRHWGSDCLKHLIGDFSFCIWDAKKREAVLAKDQLGIRPLFYAETGGGVYVATSMTVLKHALPEWPEINVDFVMKKAGHTFSQNVGETFFLGIRRLKPAHKLILSASGRSLKEERYWRLEPLETPPTGTDEELMAELMTLLVQAIACRTAHVKTVGCQLSGGLDSSAIAVLLSKQRNPSSIHSYSFVLNELTASYSESPKDEGMTQNMVLESCSLMESQHHRIEGFHFKDAVDELRFKNRVSGGLHPSDAVWQASMYKVASTHGVEVMVSGFPGDEGISNAGHQYWHDYLMSGGLRGLMNLQREFGWRAPLKIIRLFIHTSLPGVFNVLLNVRKKRSILRDQFSARMEKDAIRNMTSSLTTFKTMLSNQVTRAHTCERCESEGTYANEFGLQTTYPLADIRLLRYLISLPTRMFKPTPYSRALFRNLCKGILPEEVRLQPKFSGAKTLAFADYWIKTKYHELKTYELVDPLGVMLSEEELETREAESDFMRMKRMVNAKEMDYLIRRNLSPATALDQ